MKVFECRDDEEEGSKIQKVEAIDDRNAAERFAAEFLEDNGASIRVSVKDERGERTTWKVRARVEWTYEAERVANVGYEPDSEDGE